jgi:acetyltransferase-like isoleucine patch superfamily enzyme
MLSLVEILDRWQFWKSVDRLGPDLPATYWRLFFKSTMLKLCKEKFREFGEGAEFRPGAYAICCSKIRIGKRVIIRPGCMFFADPREGGQGITIEDHVMLGSGVHIYVHNHQFESLDIPLIDQGAYASEAVILKSGCWIGAGAIILPGITVGENAVIGAGSVVTKNVDSGSVVAGNPARFIRRIENKL